MDTENYLVFSVVGRALRRLNGDWWGPTRKDASELAHRIYQARQSCMRFTAKATVCSELLGLCKFAQTSSGEMCCFVVDRQLAKSKSQTVPSCLWWIVRHGQLFMKICGDSCKTQLFIRYIYRASFYSSHSIRIQNFSIRDPKCSGCATTAFGSPSFAWEHLAILTVSNGRVCRRSPGRRYWKTTAEYVVWSIYCLLYFMYFQLHFEFYYLLVNTL